MSFGALQVLDDVTCAVGAGERVALVGPNGAGKSTLLAIALGTEPPDAGQRIVQPDLSIGHLPQDAGCVGERTLWEELLAAFPELTAVSESLHAVADELMRPSAADPNGSEWPQAAPHAAQPAPPTSTLAALVDRQGALQERFE